MLLPTAPIIGRLQIIRHGRPPIKGETLPPEPRQRLDMYNEDGSLAPREQTFYDPKTGMSAPIYGEAVPPLPRQHLDMYNPDGSRVPSRPIQGDPKKLQMFPSIGEP